jgi:hypothetical protein
MAERRASVSAGSVTAERVCPCSTARGRAPSRGRRGDEGRRGCWRGISAFCCRSASSNVVSVSCNSAATAANRVLAALASPCKGVDLPLQHPLRTQRRFLRLFAELLAPRRAVVVGPMSSSTVVVAPGSSTRAVAAATERAGAGQTSASAALSANAGAVIFVARAARDFAGRSSTPMSGARRVRSDGGSGTGHPPSVGRARDRRSRSGRLEVRAPSLGLGVLAEDLRA